MKEERFGELLARVVVGGTDRAGSGTGPVVVLMHGFGAPGYDLWVWLPRSTFQTTRDLYFRKRRPLSVERTARAAPGGRSTWKPFSAR